MAKKVRNSLKLKKQKKEENDDLELGKREVQIPKTEKNTEIVEEGTNTIHKKTKPKVKGKTVKTSIHFPEDLHWELKNYLAKHRIKNMREFILDLVREKIGGG